MKNSILLTAVGTAKFVVLTILFLFAYIAQAQFNTGGTINRTVKFSYGGYTFTDVLTFNNSDYNFYRSQSKTQTYANYCVENASHPYLMHLAKQLDEDAAQLGYKGFQLAEYLTAFVQQLPYKSDPYNYGYDYPRYGIETIVDGGGDCEDKAALLVALLNTFGFDAILVEVPGHMAAALSCSNCGGYYNHNGKRYSFIETTYSGWCIGCVPPEYSNRGATLLNVARVNTYERNDVYAWNNNKQREDTNPFSYNGGSYTYSTGGNSTSTVIVNGVKYQVKSTGTTIITVNGTTVQITNQ